jgi:predicted RNA-binding protein with RPS1 domain
MARCWTCGKLTSEPVHKCSTCRTENAVQALRKDLSLSTDKLAKVEQQGFEVLSNELCELNTAYQTNLETFSDGFSNLAGIMQDGFEDVSNRLQEINTTLEWGFGEISWKLQQQTEILQSIDHTLKTPTQTKANEWRQMAEESRLRGVLDDAEKIFLRSLDVIEGNSLDYRTYIGLARTYIQMNEFYKARNYFEKSIPHAPDNFSEGKFPVKTVNAIISPTEKPEIGKVYNGKVTKLTDYGAFVEILAGREGLVHISELDDGYIRKVDDILKEGDEVVVKLIEIDKFGRLNLSRKAAMSDADKLHSPQPRKSLRLPKGKRN